MLKVLLCVVSFVVLANCGNTDDRYDKYFDRKIDEYVTPIAKFATEKLSKTFPSEFHYKLAKVIKAEVMLLRPTEGGGIIGGINHRLTLILGETTCKKSEFEFEVTDYCDLQDPAATYKKCTPVVFQSTKYGDEKYKILTSKCVVASEKDI